MARYRKGDVLWMVENRLRIRQVKVIRALPGDCLVRFIDVDTVSGTRLSNSRLFPTEQEAAASARVVVTESSRLPVSGCGRHYYED